MCGVYSGLRLPRSMSATCVAILPSVKPFASTSSQLRSRSVGFATYVFVEGAMSVKKATLPIVDRRRGEGRIIGEVGVLRNSSSAASTPQGGGSWFVARTQGAWRALHASDRG